MTGQHDIDPLCREVVDAALAYMASHHTDPRLTRKQVADAAHVSLRHLTRAFSRSGAGTLSGVLGNLRLRTATELLASTRLPVSEVAARAGFGSIHALRRHCRDALGCSPTALRGRHE